MKIIHCVGNLSGGGAETQLRLFYENSRGEGINNRIIALQSKGIDLYDLRDNIRIVKSKSIFRQWNEIYKLFKQEKPELIHIWLPAVFIHFLVPALIYNGARVILGVRSVYKIDSLKRCLHFMLYHFSDQYISNVHPDDLRGRFKKFTRKHFYYIPNAVNCENLGAIDKKGKGNEDIDHFLFVGRLIEDKDVLLLISAISKLNREGGRFYLDLCGDGPLKAKIFDLIDKENQKDKITLLGFQNDLAEIYSKASAIILPSRREGMPNVVFEAICFRKCLILSDIPQHKRWFSDGTNVILFKQGNLNSLCDALCRFKRLSEEDRSFMCENNMEIIRNLSLSKYCLSLINTYEKVLENR